LSSSRAALALSMAPQSNRLPSLADAGRFRARARRL